MKISTNRFSRGQSNRAMRTFILSSGMWGAWGAAVGFGNPAFTGFALYLGANESFIALFTSLAYLLALAQLLSPFISAKVIRKKNFIVGMGFAEIAFRGALIFIPFAFPPDLRLTAMVCVIAASLFSGNIVGPIYNTWVSNAVPEQIRARFTGRQTILSTIVAMVSGFAIGQFIDIYRQTNEQAAFMWVFIIGSLFGFLGYAYLSRAPFPVHEQDQKKSMNLKDLVTPFTDRHFFRAAIFFGLWTFAQGLAGPLYSVFMLDRLKISYTEISVFNALFMATSILGYKVWSILIDRFGSKAVLQLLAFPSACIPLLWIFNDSEDYFLIPVALILGGIFYSGMSIAVNPLLFQLLPRGQHRTLYLAAWSVAVNLMGALGPLIGGLLSQSLIHVTFSVSGYTIGNIQLLFALSSLACFVNIFFLQRLKDTKQNSSKGLLSKIIRGNLPSYAYNATIFSVAHTETARAKAAEALGRSGSPLAIEKLVQALADASPIVRRSAARALGKSGSDHAIDPLLRELKDGYSDIRSEAAEALGQLGSANSIDPLVEALSDSDLRVRISAIRGLGKIPGDEVHELLYWHFTSEFDPKTYPTLVEVLSVRKDQRVVKPTLSKLGDFRSSAMRSQLLNSVCRAIGAGDQFYRLLSQENTRRIDSITKLIKETTDQILQTKTIENSDKILIIKACETMLEAFEQENIMGMYTTASEVAKILRDSLSGKANKAYQVLSIFVIIVALDSFIKRDKPSEDSSASREVFVVVCLYRIARLIRSIEL